ncbi:MAG: hypothetical protein M1838_005558 [Thelocarpon superellum]|nr:MAG: hypothetical protein M1838_005558 [Thelocarpon superellum]
MAKGGADPDAIADADAEDRHQDDGASSSSSNDDDDDGHGTLDLVESLVAGREKRATAGNRLSSLLDREADDELELLFAEDEEDIEFEGGEADDQSDVQLDSSSEEDEAPPADGVARDDDLQGERELQRQARAERQAKKRKTQDAFFAAPRLRKKVKINPTTITTTAEPVMTTVPRPKKKSERVSWIPETTEGPTRSSSRRATVQNKEIVHARMKEYEKRRLQQLAIMEAAAKRKDKTQPKAALTQADRLAEAARTEKLNSKSLNRWEETEKKRSEEQAARLAALQNRRVEGPVITWWSGLAEWVNGKVTYVGRRLRIEDAGSKHDGNLPPPMVDAEAKAEAPSRAPAALGPDRAEGEAPPSVKPALDADGPSNPAAGGMIRRVDAGVMVLERREDPSLAPPVPPQPPQPMVERSTRNVLILENFDPLAIRDRDVQRRILFNQRRLKLHKTTHELCVITSQPAKFRDPSTGLPYLNAYAYKEIQRLRASQFMWSTLLGCYVGPTGAAANGVPDRWRASQHAERSQES